MKKTAVLMIVLMAGLITSVAIAKDKDEGKVGKLFLFQKCDEGLKDTENYDASGCPSGEGPWAIFPDNRRWGQMKYNLLGEKFKFSFEGKKLVPEKDYTLIYYPDPWPGTGLICLGAGTSNPAGNLQIHGKEEIISGLPAEYDANFTPVAPSGAVGAKIWLVLTDDVQCPSETDETLVPQMLGWNPALYLFEANPIVYQYSSDLSEPEEDDDDDGDGDVEEEEEEEGEDEGEPSVLESNNSKRKK